MTDWEEEERAWTRQFLKTVAEVAAPWRLPDEAPLRLGHVRALMERAAAGSGGRARQLWEHAALQAGVACWGADWTGETSREVWEMLLVTIRRAADITSSAG